MCSERVIVGQAEEWAVVGFFKGKRGARHQRKWTIKYEIRGLMSTG